jgi:hypothetical protein
MKIFHVDAVEDDKKQNEQVARTSALVAVLQCIIAAKSADDSPAERVFLSELAGMIGIDVLDSISAWAAAMDVFLFMTPTIAIEPENARPSHQPFW